MKERKQLTCKGTYTRDDHGEVVPLTGRLKAEVGSKAYLIVTELETGQQYEYAEEA